MTGKKENNFTNTKHTPKIWNIPIKFQNISNYKIKKFIVLILIFEYVAKK